MSARILDGKTTAAAIRAEVADRVKALAERETVPGLVAVLVGDDPPSKIYVSGKQKASEEIGIRSRRIDLIVAGVSVQRRAGVNLVELLRRIVTAIEDQDRVEEEARAASAQATANGSQRARPGAAAARKKRMVRKSKTVPGIMSNRTP